MQVAGLQGSIATPRICMEMGDQIVTEPSEPFVQGLLLTAASTTVATSVAESCE
jgi:hypothetical protein